MSTPSLAMRISTDRTVAGREVSAGLPWLTVLKLISGGGSPPLFYGMGMRLNEALHLRSQPMDPLRFNGWER